MENDSKSVFDECLELIKDHQRAIEGLRTVAISHVERFTSVSKFADAAGTCIKDMQANVGNLINGVTDLANLVGRLEKRISVLEETEQTRKRFN